MLFEMSSLNKENYNTYTETRKHGSDAGKAIHGNYSWWSSDINFTTQRLYVSHLKYSKRITEPMPEELEL